MKKSNEGITNPQLKSANESIMISEEKMTDKVFAISKMKPTNESLTLPQMKKSNEGITNPQLKSANESIMISEEKMTDKVFAISKMKPTNESLVLPQMKKTGALFEQKEATEIQNARPLREKPLSKNIEQENSPNKRERSPSSSQITPLILSKKFKRRIISSDDENSPPRKRLAGYFIDDEAGVSGDNSSDHDIDSDRDLEGLINDSSQLSGEVSQDHMQGVYMRSLDAGTPSKLFRSSKEMPFIQRMLEREKGIIHNDSLEYSDEESSSPSQTRYEELSLPPNQTKFEEHPKLKYEESPSLDTPMIWISPRSSRSLETAIFQNLRFRPNEVEVFVHNQFTCHGAHVVLGARKCVLILSQQQFVRYLQTNIDATKRGWNPIESKLFQILSTILEAYSSILVVVQHEAKEGPDIQIRPDVGNPQFLKCYMVIQDLADVDIVLTGSYEQSANEIIHAANLEQGCEMGLRGLGMQKWHQTRNIPEHVSNAVNFLLGIRGMSLPSAIHLVLRNKSLKKVFENFKNPKTLCEAIPGLNVRISGSMISFINRRKV